MADSKVSIGLVAGAEGLQDLKEKLGQESGVEVVAETTEYASESNPRAFNRFVRANPDIVILEAQGLVKTTDALTVLRSRVPDTWLLALSEAQDPMVIIEAVRAGAREFLPKPVSQQALNQAIERFNANKFRDKDVKEAGRVYWVTSGKGGAGATTVAINLAASMSKMVSARVVMIDLSLPVGDATPYLNLRNEFTVTDVLANAERLDPVLLESYVTNTKGLAVLPGARDFRSGRLLTAEAIETLLDVARQAYAHVLVDLPGLHDEQVLGMMARISQDILVVLTPELPAIWRTHRLLSYLETIIHPEELNTKAHLVLNRADSRTDLSRADIEKTLERKIKWKLSDDFQAAIEAINSGTPLVSLNNSGLAADYELLARGLTGVSESKKRSFLGLFPN